MTYDREEHYHQVNILHTRTVNIARNTKKSREEKMEKVIPRVNLLQDFRKRFQVHTGKACNVFPLRKDKTFQILGLEEKRATARPLQSDTWDTKIFHWVK